MIGPPTIKPPSDSFSVHSAQGHGSLSAEVINPSLQRNLFVSLKCFFNVQHLKSLEPYHCPELL